MLILCNFWVRIKIVVVVVIVIVVVRVIGVDRKFDFSCNNL